MVETIIVFFHLTCFYIQDIQLQWQVFFLSFNKCTYHASHLRDQTIIPYNKFNSRKLCYQKILKAWSLVIRSFRFIGQKHLCTRVVRLTNNWQFKKTTCGWTCTLTIKEEFETNFFWDLQWCHYKKLFHKLHELKTIN